MTDPSTSVKATKSSLPAVISWLAILGVIAFIVTAQVLPELRGKKPVDASNASQLTLLGKYFVGIKVVFPMALEQENEKQSIHAQVEQLSKTPQDALRGAVILAEAIGADSGLERIDRVSTTQPAIQEDVQALRSIYRHAPTTLPAEQGERLAERYGFLGRLAKVFGRDDSDPERAAVLAEAKRTFLVIVTWIITLLVFLGTGAVLLVIAIVFRMLKSMATKFEPPIGGNSAYLEAFALYLVLFMGFQVILPLVIDGRSLAWSWVAIILLPVSIGWVRYRGQSWGEIRRAFGLHTGRGVHVEAPLGIASYLAGLPVVAVGFVATALLLRLSGNTPSHPIIHEATSGRASALSLYLLACVFAPVFEELMFRGALFAHLRQRWGWWFSAATVALIFAAVHPQGWETIPLLGSIALVLAAAREWRGSIIAPIVCHACVNFMTVTLLVLISR